MLPLSDKSVRPTTHRLEADFQNRAIDADQPSGFGAGEGYGPEAIHAIQGEPGLALVGSPGRAARIGGDDHGTIGAVFSLALLAAATRIGQAEDGSGDWRCIGKGPGSA